MFGSSIPTRAYDVYGREILVPSNYDPVARTYSGIWDGSFVVAWSDNPAWCFLDMLTNRRFGLGQAISIDDADTAKLYVISQYCDELVPDGSGGMEPRFSLNCVIQTRADAYQLLNTMITAFRGMIYWHSNTVSFGYDAPRDTDVLVGRANVIGGAFTYSGTSANARHNSVQVTWNDPAQQFVPNIEIVDDNEDISKRGLQQTQIYAFGCTSRGQAARLGRWLLYTEKAETETVMYQASLDHLNVVPGMVVGLVDPQTSGADYAGRLQSIDGAAMTLDRAVTLPSDESFEISVIDPTGLVQTRDIVGGAGQVLQTLTLNAPFSPVPQPNAMWAITSTAVEPRPFRVISVVETTANIFEITALAFNPTKYDFVDRDVALTPVNYSELSSGVVVPPTAMDINESLYLSNGVLTSQLTLSWTRSTDSRVYLYNVVWKTSDGGIAQSKFTSDNAIDLISLTPGTYDFFVYAVAAVGKSVPLTELNHKVLGKFAPPPDVKNLKATQSVNGVFLSWDVVVDVGGVSYEIRQGSDWDTAVLVSNISGTTVFAPIADMSLVTFLVRAIDIVGVYSAGSASVITSVIAPRIVPDFTAVAQADSVLFRWTQVPGISNLYEIRQGVSWDTAELIGVSSGDEFYTLDPQRDDTVYWIKTKATTGLYSTTARAATAQRALIPDINVILEYDNANDGGAGLYPGVTYYMEDGPDSSLVLAEITTGVFQPNGEHYFTYDLGAEIRARNWLETTLINIEAGPTWDDFTYAWESINAQVPWLPLGDLAGASLTKVIAFKQSPLTVELYAWTYQDTSTDFRGVTSAEEDHIDYEPAKFADGLLINDLTHLSYSVTLPQVFSAMWKFRVEAPITDKRVFIVLEKSGESDRIEIGYDAAAGGLYCLDNVGNYFTLPFAQPISGLNFIAVGFVQDEESRTLYYRSEREYSSVYEQAAFTPLTDAFDTLYLHRGA